jgi:hypothetical protein
MDWIWFEIFFFENTNIMPVSADIISGFQNAKENKEARAIQVKVKTKAIKDANTSVKSRREERV